MKPLQGKIAVVTGASRGAGRGIALALGEGGATVYVVGRTTRSGPPAKDGAPGTIEDTADEVTARGGRGIPVRADCTVEPEVAAVFARVQKEQGRLDVLANAVWGAADAATSSDPDKAGDDLMANWGKPFWEQPIESWQHMMAAGPGAYFLASHHAAKMMAAAGSGLIVGLTDFYVEGAPEGDNPGQLLWGLSHTCINLLHRGMAAEAKDKGIAVITLMPGFMRTERVERAMKSDELKKMFRYDLSESVEFTGRAVAALAADEHRLKKTGRILYVADLGQEYGFTDVDGRQIPRFNPQV